MLDILYRDDQLVAIHKPAGLLVHRSELARHETEFAVQLLRDQLGLPVHPAHRLDRGTSGVLLFALDKAVLAPLSSAFETQQVEKEYLAVVRGWPDADGIIDHALARLRDDAEWKGEHQSTTRQEARTRYTRLAMVELPLAIDRYPSSRYALLRLWPETGRRHQIRRHLKHIAHPIIGDATYGKGAHNRAFQSLFGCHRLLLACTRMRLTHPVSGATLDLRAPLAADFRSVLDQLGWAMPED